MPSESARKSLTKQIETYHHTILPDGPISSYLHNRGITRQSAEKFMLGSDRGRLVIPYLTPAGPWHLKYRCVTDHDHAGHGKYVNDPGSESHLYNAAVLLTATTAVVVEGEIDAISVDQIGLPAVGYPGTAMWKANAAWRWCFDSCDEIAVVADGDQPGRDAANYVTDTLKNSVSADIHVVILPDGEDANSFIHRFGERAFLDELGWL